ncbi:hypothetical protein B0H14DRAFT_2573518 [Mycena olivaceomarginata]|nr:hypothetical protein B0H14DRAFT_2573518 [Mycena olivaceomarginata]
MLLHRMTGMLGVTRDEKIGSDVLKVARDLVLGKTTLCRRNCAYKIDRQSEMTLNRHRNLAHSDVLGTEGLLLRLAKVWFKTRDEHRLRLLCRQLLATYYHRGLKYKGPSQA